MAVTIYRDFNSKFGTFSNQNNQTMYNQNNQMVHNQSNKAMYNQNNQAISNQNNQPLINQNVIPRQAVTQNIKPNDLRYKNPVSGIVHS